MTHRDTRQDAVVGNPGEPSGAAGIVLAVACAAQLMVVLDVSVVIMALPSIRAALGFDETGQQWVINAYALVFAGFLLLGGRLADLYGRRRIFLAGVVVFTGASLAGGLADSAGLLVPARGVQGLGAAVLAPATLTILTATFPEGHRRTKALATWTAVGIAGGTAGNLVGGVLTEYLSWRSTLLINVPIGALAIALILRFVRADRPGPARPRLDAAGAVLATAGLGSLAFGITRAASSGWSSTATVAGVVIGVLLLVAFVVVEARWAVAPLIPLQLFAIRSVSAGNLTMLLAGACLNPMWFFLTLSMQNVLGYGHFRCRCCGCGRGIGFDEHRQAGRRCAGFGRVGHRRSDPVDHCGGPVRSVSPRVLCDRGDHGRRGGNGGVAAGTPRPALTFDRRARGESFLVVVYPVSRRWMVALCCLSPTSWAFLPCARTCRRWCRGWPRWRRRRCRPGTGRSRWCRGRSHS